MTACPELEHLSNSAKPKVLVVTHAMGGGVERHVAELADALAQQALFIRLHPGRGKIYLSLPSWEDHTEQKALAFLWPSQAESLWALLAQLGVNQVHVHHVLGWPHEFWEQFAERVSSYDLTLHDHLIFCRLANKVTINDAWLIQVRRCFTGGSANFAEDLYQLALKARRLYVPSQLMAERIKQLLPELGGSQLTVRPHPEAEVQHEYPQPFLRPLAQDKPLRVLCLGMLSVEKGAQVLADVAQSVAKQKLPFEFHLLGTCHLHLPKSIKRHGSYLDKDIADWIERIDPHVLWLPAQSPETWSYTLSAGLRAGLPIIATHTGAFPERLEQRPLSWLIEVGCSCAEWLAVLQRVRAEHAERRQAASLVWHPAAVEVFYTAQQGGYLGAGTACLSYKAAVFNPSDLNTALALAELTVENWGDRALRMLLGLKSSACFAPFFRMIPYSWQRRAKRWISRAPVNEVVKK